MRKIFTDLVDVKGLLMNDFQYIWVYFIIRV